MISLVNMGVLGWKMLLLTAGSVGWKGRGRAVPQAVATCLWSRMFLPWPNASRRCFFPVFEHNQGYFYPCPFYTWIPGKASILSPYKDYRHLDNNKLRNRQVLAAWFQPAEFIWAYKLLKPHLPGSDTIWMFAELLDTLSNNDEAQGLYEYFQVCISCFWPLQTAACLAYGAGRMPWCVWYWNSFEAGNGVCKLTSSLACLHTSSELGSAKGPSQLANNICLAMLSFGHTVLEQTWSLMTQKKSSCFQTMLFLKLTA